MAITEQFLFFVSHSPFASNIFDRVHVVWWQCDLGFSFIFFVCVFVCLRFFQLDSIGCRWHTHTLHDRFASFASFHHHSWKNGEEGKILNTLNFSVVRWQWIKGNYFLFRHKGAAAHKRSSTSRNSNWWKWAQTQRRPKCRPKKNWLFEEIRCIRQSERAREGREEYEKREKRICSFSRCFVFLFGMNEMVLHRQTGMEFHFLRILSFRFVYGIRVKWPFLHRMQQNHTHIQNKTRRITRRMAHKCIYRHFSFFSFSLCSLWLSHAQSALDVAVHSKYTDNVRPTMMHAQKATHLILASGMCVCLRRTHMRKIIVGPFDDAGPQE